MRTRSKMLQIQSGKKSQAISAATPRSFFCAYVHHGNGKARSAGIAHTPRETFRNAARTSPAKSLRVSCGEDARCHTWDRPAHHGCALTPDCMDVLSCFCLIRSTAEFAGLGRNPFVPFWDHFDSSLASPFTARSANPRASVADLFSDSGRSRRIPFSTA
jgi:hypothetical protein